jgi:hypothetical protein
MVMPVIRKKPSALRRIKKKRSFNMGLSYLNMGHKKRLPEFRQSF